MRYAEGAGDGDDPEDFFIAKDFTVAKQLQFCLWLAINAGKIAAVGNGYTQIVDAAFVRIVYRHVKNLP
jgi:hypothetical protein